MLILECQFDIYLPKVNKRIRNSHRCAKPKWNTPVNTRIACVSLLLIH